MPMTVITITKAPAKLRGDLTKWMQEIDTGVYVGNFNSRIREKLWDRVSDCIGSGQATMSYSSRNEIGYDFETLYTSRRSVCCANGSMPFISRVMPTEYCGRPAWRGRWGLKISLL